MAVLGVPPYLQFFDADGNPLAGGTITTYAAGTTTPKATYTDSTGNTVADNPIELDSSGIPDTANGSMWLIGSYKFVVKDALGNTIRTTDNVTAFTTLAEANDAYFQSFSGTGSQTAFTTSDDLGTEEKGLMIFVDSGTPTVIANGDFATDTIWTKGAGWTIGSGVATATGAISTGISQNATVTLVAGLAYNVTYTITRSAGGLIPSIGGQNGTERTASGTYRETIVAGSTQNIAFTGNGFTGTLDAVTISLANGKGYEILSPSAYTINGTALTFATAPASGTNNIYVFAPTLLLGAASAAAGAAEASATAALASEVAADAAEAGANAAALTAVNAAASAASSAGTATTQATTATNAANSILTDAGFIAVAADLAGADTIGTVAADITEVAAVGANIAAVVAVDANETNINAVAADATNINTVATNIASVNTAATNIAAIIAAPTEASNAAASAVSAAASAVLAGSTFTATSTTSNSITVATGKSFTTQTNKNFQTGQFMTIVDAANNANYMFGRVASYNNGTGALVFDSENVGGSGTKTSWNISIAATAYAGGGSGISTTGVRTNGYYCGFGGQTPVNNGQVMVANTLYTNFFVNPASDTFTRIGVNVSSFAAGNVRLGIYNVANGIPTTLVLDAGTASTGSNGEKEITISQALAVGTYALCAVFDATPSVFRLNTSTAVFQPIYGQDTGFLTLSNFATSFTYGTLPSTHPTPTAVVGGNIIPAIWLRKV